MDNVGWPACCGFFLPVRVLSRLFRRLFLEKLTAAHQAEHLHFFGEHFALGAHKDFLAFVKPLRNIEWVVYAKRPFAGPDAVLAYLSRYTHRVAIANSRLIACDERGVTIKWKDSSCMSIHAASTGSAITACSPITSVPMRSGMHANC
jgi:hypothetical protein